MEDFVVMLVVFVSVAVIFCGLVWKNYCICGC